VLRVSLADAAYRFRHALVTEGALSESAPLGERADLPGARNYIEWIRWAPVTPPASGRSLRRHGMENPPLLFLLLVHGLLREYVDTALRILLDNRGATEGNRREPELIGIPLGTTGDERRPVWERLDVVLPAVTAPRTLGEFLADRGRPETRGLDEYRDGALGTLQTLPTAELERLLSETLDTCSHRLDAWITSLATHRLAVMRVSQPGGCHLGAYGWLEGLRPAPDEEFEDRQLPDGQSIRVRKTSGGYVHAPSLTHAAAAAVLRNGYLTRAAEAENPLAIDLSSRRVRAARRLLDGVRQGQPLGALLGYQFERALHAHQLEKYIDPLRSRYPLVANKGNPAAAAAAGATDVIAARNVMDGLTVWRTESPFDGLADPATGQPAAAEELAVLKAEVSRIRESLDGVADLLTAEAVYQRVRGNTESVAASLDAMAQGLQPPDPEIARTPRGGETLTHRVVVVLGGDAIAPGTGWPRSRTPRARAEPYLDGWLGALLGDPRAAKCTVSYPAPTAHDPDRRRTVELSLSELRLRPVDVLALAGESVAGGGASEIDRRVVDAVLARPRTASPDPDTLRITYAPQWSRPRGATRTFADVLEVARALRAVLGGSRPLRPADLLTPDVAAVASEADLIATEAESRARAARIALSDAHNALDVAIADAEALSPTTPSELSPLLDALRAAALFGVPGAFPQGRAADALLAQARSVRAELGRRRTAADAAPDPVAVATEVFGPGFVFLRRFRPAAGSAEELGRAIDGGADLLGIGPDMQDAPERWFQVAARVRPSLARWRKVGLLTRALGGPAPEFEVAQLPHAPGARWVALPTADGERHPSGRLSLVFHSVATPAPTEPWVGLLLDEWTEKIPAAAAQTAVAFQQDVPRAEAPQVILLAVPPAPPADVPFWDAERLVDILRETLGLAKMRAVDGELLGELGQILPAMYVAENAAGDTVAANLSRFRVGD
jgi:hypothetical protein